MKYINTEKAVIKSWCENPEESAIDQAKNLANLPFLYKHVALMSDTHMGYGMPIGGVIATKGVIIPNAVGVDIGCGMCAVRTSLNDMSTEDLKTIMSEIRKVIPVGFNKHKERQDKKLMPSPETITWKGLPCDEEYHVVSREYQNALISLGTLGGGNHFIEIQKGDDGYIWIMIHSGSRNLGLKVAEYYNKLAKDLNEKWHTAVPKEWDLAFLPCASPEARDYLREMQYCLDFALASRKLMMERICEIFHKQFPTLCLASSSATTSESPHMINIHHNYVVQEHHFGKNVFIHRKGATSARKGEIGIIPGSQGTNSYIVKGLGNPDSFNSCSHGAGRKMGRKHAQRTLDLAKEQKLLDDQGIIHAIRGVGDLDEAPGSYKDIDLVMAEQKDLVEIVVKLKPLAVIKG